MSGFRDPITAGAVFAFVCYYAAAAVALLYRERRLDRDGTTSRHEEAPAEPAVGPAPTPE